MINLIQTVPVKAPVIADFQRLCLRDAPFHQRIDFIFDSCRFVGGDADIVKRIVRSLDPVDFLLYQVGL